MKTLTLTTFLCLLFIAAMVTTSAHAEERATPPTYEDCVFLSDHATHTAQLTLTQLTGLKKTESNDCREGHAKCDAIDDVDVTLRWDKSEFVAWMNKKSSNLDIAALQSALERAVESQQAMINAGCAGTHLQRAENGLAIVSQSGQLENRAYLELLNKTLDRVKTGNLAVGDQKLSLLEIGISLRPLIN